LGNLATPQSVQKLQTALHAKAKARSVGQRVDSVGVHVIRNISAFAEGQPMGSAVAAVDSNNRFFMTGPFRE
jgi:hypothetical protein